MTIREMRMQAGMSRKEFSEYLSIPWRTIEQWENGFRNPAPYLVELIKYKLEHEGLIKKEEEA